MAPKRGLGRGLASLIPTDIDQEKNINKKESTKDSSSAAKKESKAASTTKTVVEEIPEDKKVQTMKLSQIEPNPDQPRKNFDDDPLQELAESIKEYGIIDPVIVTKKGKHYQIIAGERRWRAARLAGLKEIPVIVRDYSKQEIAEISLIENIQRQNLNPIEEAIAYQKLIEDFNLKQDEVAERVAKSRTAITNTMRLLKLSEKVQQMVIDEKLSSGHARALLAIEDETVQYDIACKVFDESLNVRQTEALVKATLKNLTENNSEDKKETETLDHQFLYTAAEEQLKEILGSKVSIKAKNKNKGKIEIEYFSNDELENLIDRIKELR